MHFTCRTQHKYTESLRKSEILSDSLRCRGYMHKNHKILQEALRYFRFSQIQQPHYTYTFMRATPIHNAFTYTESYRGLTEIFFQTLYDLKATCTKILQKALRYSNFFQTQQPHSIYKSNRAIQIHNAFTPTMHTTIQMQVVLQEGYSNAQSTQRTPSSQTITACCVGAIKRWHYQWCKEHGHGQSSCLRQCQ